MSTFLPPFWTHNDDGTLTQGGGPPGSYQGLCDSNYNPIRRSNRRDADGLNAVERMNRRREASLQSKREREWQDRVSALQYENRKLREKLDSQLSRLDKSLSQIEARLDKVEANLDGPK